MSKKEALTFYALVSPFILHFVFLGIIPLAMGLYISFTNFTGFNFDKMKPVGLSNYLRVFTDNDALYSLARTFTIGIINVPLGIIFCFFLSLLLVQNVKGIGLFRTIYYLPSVIPGVAAGLMWKIMFGRDYGVINTILDKIGFKPVWWLGPDFATTSLIIMLVWGAGGGILINIAGLKNIPQELYESAALDGATGWKKMRYITLPLFTPILFFNILMGVIGMLQLFAQPVLLSNGTGLLSVPLRENYTYVVHIYQQVFGYQRFGYGLALSWVVTVIILILTMITLKTSKNWVHYEVGQDGGGN
jgi:multiple sugar transport system permease protein